MGGRASSHSRSGSKIKAPEGDLNSDGLESDDERHIVNVSILCDYTRQTDRGDCDPADQLPELSSDCGHFNQCWRD